MKPIRKTSPMSAGAVVQLCGLAACFVVFPLGIVAGLVLIVIGGAMARYWACGSCGNKLTDRSVRMCPTCRQPVE